MKDKLNHKICFRADDALYEQLQETAQDAGISVGEYIRRTLTNRRVIVRHETIVDFAELRAIIAELGKIGSNINQIAHYFNGGGLRSRQMYERTQQALSQVYEMKCEIEKMGGKFHGNTQTSRREEQ